MGDKYLPGLPVIIKGCIEGNNKCYEILYKSYYGYIMGIALRYVINKELAEEITNDCFIKVFSNIQKYDKEKSFKTWIRRIAINTCIDKLRRERRFLSLNEGKIEEEALTDEPLFQDIDFELILLLLKRLPILQRLVFNLYEIEGYSHFEISGQLNIKENSSRTYLTRAKQKLKRDYQQLNFKNVQL